MARENVVDLLIHTRYDSGILQAYGNLVHFIAIADIAFNDADIKDIIKLLRHAGCDGPHQVEFIEAIEKFLYAAAATE